jgi:hypothetical protein
LRGAGGGKFLSIFVERKEKSSFAEKNRVMSKRRAYMGEFFLGTSKTSFGALCVGGIGMVFVEVFGGEEWSYEGLKGLWMIGLGIVVSGSLLYMGYRLMRKEDEEEQGVERERVMGGRKQVVIRKRK